MSTRLIAVIGVVAAASAVASCERVAPGAWGYTTWKCFTVDVASPPVPHLEKDDQYCVVTRNDAWYLDPGRGMSNWKPIGGGSRIPLLITDDGETSKAWKFEVEITDHDNSDHGKQHRAGRGYTLEAIIPATGKAEANIKVDGPFGDSIHNGSAHSIQD